MNVVRPILALKFVLHGLQRRPRVKPYEDIRRTLGNDEIGGEEANEGRPEQHG